MALFARTRSTRAEQATDQAEVDRLAWTWRLVCEGAGLARTTPTVTGPTVTVPTLVHVVLGPPTVLTVALLAGQLATDVRACARRLAAGLGAAAVRVEPRGRSHVLVTLLDVDPLADVLALDDPGPPGTVWIGRAEDDRDLILDSWADAPHTVVQGVTRSGKSAFAYALLAQVARDPAVRVAGVDPTGLLLRPFAGTADAGWQTIGLRDLPAIETLLTRLVTDMDDRITGLPADRDTADLSPALPCVLVVLEEWPGVLRALDAADPKIGKRVRPLVARLLAEGAKVGYRVVMLAQRAEAAVIGAFERAMCSLRISFRTDNRTSVELLHPGADPDTADAHATALPGVALVTTPGEPLTRVRAPFLGGYSAFCAAIRAVRADQSHQD